MHLILIELKKARFSWERNKEKVYHTIFLAREDKPSIFTNCL